VPLFGEARTSKLNRLKRILRSSLELKHGSEEGLRVPELELTELENGTRLCQASERSALAPTEETESNPWRFRCQRRRNPLAPHYREGA
jgi:hypothetical protein